MRYLISIAAFLGGSAFAATVIAIAAFLASDSAFAADYSVTATWTDTSVVNTGYTYTPNYDVEYRVAAGAATAVNGVGVTTWAGTISATPEQTIEVRVRAKNIAPAVPLVGAWSAWANASAPTPYTMPGTPSTPILIIVPL